MYSTSNNMPMAICGPVTESRKLQGDPAWSKNDTMKNTQLIYGPIKWQKAQEVCYKEILTAWLQKKVSELGTDFRTTAVTKTTLWIRFWRTSVETKSQQEDALHQKDKHKEATRTSRMHHQSLAQKVSSVQAALKTLPFVGVCNTLEKLPGILSFCLVSSTR